MLMSIIKRYKLQSLTATLKDIKFLLTKHKILHTQYFLYFSSWTQLIIRRLVVHALWKNRKKNCQHKHLFTDSSACRIPHSNLYHHLVFIYDDIRKIHMRRIINDMSTTRIFSVESNFDLLSWWEELNVDKLLKNVIHS